MRDTLAMTDWAEDLTTIALTWRTGNKSIRDLFREAGPPKGLTPDDFRMLIAERLRDRSDLADAWQTYSYDKRSSPSPYLDHWEVGYFDGDRQDVVTHTTPVDACVDFLYRETEWVLHHRRVM